jgi:hypothetical protein
MDANYLFMGQVVKIVIIPESYDVNLGALKFLVQVVRSRLRELPAFRVRGLAGYLYSELQIPVFQPIKRSARSNAADII